MTKPKTWTCCGALKAEGHLPTCLAYQDKVLVELLYSARAHRTDSAEEQLVALATMGSLPDQRMAPMIRSERFSCRTSRGSRSTQRYDPVC